MPEQQSQNIVFVGPTACGKSAAGLMVAREFLGAEVICLDKATAWRDMDIGTAKPTRGQREMVPHQLVNIFQMGWQPWRQIKENGILNDKFGTCPSDITQIMTNEARRHINRLRQAGQTAICVGGSPSLYASLYEGHDFTSARQHVREWGDTHTQYMIDHLKSIGATLPFNPDETGVALGHDPAVLLEQIVEAKTRQVHNQKAMQDALVIGIDTDPALLDKRIVDRVDEMLDEGLYDEVMDLTKRYGWVMPLRTTIGYKEWAGWSPREFTGLRWPDIIDQIIANTQRYARRQRAWLKQRPEVRWVSSPNAAAELAIRSLQSA